VSPDENDSFIAMPPPAPPTEAGPARAAPAPDAGDDGFILLPPGIALDSSTFRVPVRTPPVREPSPPTAPVTVPPRASSWRLALPGGAAPVRVTSSVLVGRNPAASDDWPDATLLTVDDLTSSVSKTHALLEIDGGALWVHDLNSTNGSFVVVGDEVVEVSPGTRSAVPDGADLELGEYVMRIELSRK
jgi:hypothetical protein